MQHADETALAFGMHLARGHCCTLEWQGCCADSEEPPASALHR